MDVSDCIIHDTEYENSNGGKFSSFFFALDNRIFYHMLGGFIYLYLYCGRCKRGEKEIKNMHSLPFFIDFN